MINVGSEIARTTNGSEKFRWKDLDFDVKGF